MLFSVPKEPFPYIPPVIEPEFPAAGIKDMSKATIALVTTTGIVPKGNPDRIPSSNASIYGYYNISGVDDLIENGWETADGEYDPAYANMDADRMVPVDVLRDLEKEGMIGKLYNQFWSTSGNGMAIVNAKRMAAEIAEQIKTTGIDCIIVTSTGGTGTRAGATIAKEIETLAKIPVAIICVVVPIAKTVGASRIIPGIAIPHVLGNPALTPEEEKALRRGIVEKAVTALSTDVYEPTIFE